MGRIQAGVGLISGIDTANLIQQLMALEARGKIPLQTRVAQLQSQQSSLLDISARLLSLKSSAAGFRTNLVFDRALAASSDESVLTATATAAQPGVFNFTVKQLVSNSQKLSKGFADSTVAPAGLGSLSFEFGKGKLSTDTDLLVLNGGEGVRRGKIVIDDGTATNTTVNLSTATTIGEVLKAINESGANVTASVTGDRLKIVEKSGAALAISNAVGDFTATDLGIEESVAAPGILTGDQINSISSETALRQLNDGTGVFITDGTADIKITTRAGPTIDVDFGRINDPITATTLIEDLNNGAGVTLNSDTEGDILFVDRNGDSHEVDLTGIETVQDLMDEVSAQTGGDITITITGGNKFVVNDNTGGGGLLKIQGFGVNDEETANDLGILNAAGVDAPTHTGTLIVNAAHTPQARTIQDVIDRINDDTENLGYISAAIAPDGVSLFITDNNGGPGNLKVESTLTNPYAASDLGIEADVASDFINGTRLIAAMNSTLVRSLNGGTGLAGATTLRIIDKDGGTDVFTLDEEGSVQDIIDLINDSALVEVTASLNETGTGLFIQDTTDPPGAANLRVYDTAAAALGIDTGIVGTTETFVRGTNAQTRYVAEGSRLEDLNYGRGVGTGSFRITDGEGNQVTISIGSDSVLLYDVIEEINALAAAQDVDITARVNDNGDGIQIDNDLGTGLIRVDSLSGTVAEDLGITGTAEADGGPIDGSYERVVELNTSDTLTEIIDAIDAANLPVAVSVVNTGAGPKPFHLSFASEITGKPGELIIEGFDGSGDFSDLELATVAEAQNAKIFFGAADPADAVLIERSVNQLTDVLEGVTIDLHSASDDPVTLSISRDVPSITESVSTFVTAFNDAIDRIDAYDFFNTETETRGPLLGNPTTSRVRASLFRVLQGPATGLTGRYTRLSEVGITIGSDNNVRFDSEKFLEAYELDPDAVEELFSAFDSTTATSEEISPGVSVAIEETTVTESGFGELFNSLLDDLTNSLTGVLPGASSTIQDQIDLTNDRIAEFDDRLEARRARLEREFTAMEEILARLQVQAGSLTSLLGNVSLAQGLSFQ